MHIFTKNRKIHIAKNIRKGLERRFPGRGRNRLLAGLLGVSPATVSRWASGGRTPDLARLNRLSRVLGIALHRLCGCSGRQPVRTKSRLFDIVMNLSIAAERTRCGADGEIRAAAERIGKILTGLLDSRQVRPPGAPHECPNVVDLIRQFYYAMQHAIAGRCRWGIRNAA